MHEFIDVIQADDEALATVHHYAAKAQAAYLRQLKDTLDTDSVIIWLDFAEN